MIDETKLRQTANDLGRSAAMVTEMAFDAGTDSTQLKKDLDILMAATEVCRRAARRSEARRAQLDDKAPLCMGCQHRKDVPAGYDCSLALDTKAACTKRVCQQYKAE